ncbi:MAG: hypothetical protein ABIP51_16020 [Bacteroidia bacterium]
MTELKFTKAELDLALINTTTWNGLDLDGFYSKALLEPKSLEKFRLLTDVKGGKAKVAKVELANLIQPFDCTFATTNINLDQKTLTNDDFKVNLELCQTDYEATYLSTKMRAGSNGNIAPEDFITYVVDLVGKQLGNDFEKAAWGGGLNATYPNTITNGIIYQASGDTGTTKVTAVSAITSSNVVTELGRVFNAIPITIRDTEECTIYASSYIVAAYRTAVALATGNGGAYTTSVMPLNYLNVKIIEAKGMPNLMMVAGQDSNFVELVDLADDAKKLNVINMYNTVGTPTMRIVSNFKFGVGYVQSTEVVLYS